MCPAPVRSGGSGLECWDPLPLGLAFLWLLPIRSVTWEQAGREAGEDRRCRAGTGRDISVLADVFAVRSVGSGEPFPPGQLQIPLKQVSVSALAQLNRVPEETAERGLGDLGDTAAAGTAGEG